MPEQNIARVIFVPTSSTRAIVLIGDVEHEVDWSGDPLCLGDVFTATTEGAVQLIRRIGRPSPGAWETAYDALRWRKRDTAGRTRMDVLRQRHTIRRAVRAYFDKQNFIEVDTPLLVHGTTPDATLNSFVVGDRYLITSAEYQIKRLEVAGFDLIYTLTQNYRCDDGEGRFRNPEFTMLEWARVGSTMRQIESDAEQLIWSAHKALSGTGTLLYQGHRIDIAPPWDRTTVCGAILRFTGATLMDFSLSSIQQVIQTVGIVVSPQWSDDIYYLFSLIMDHIQPLLGLSRPLFVTDWPAFETSSAGEKEGQHIAERSELFIGGVEISDGFPSLTDFDRQIRTFDEQQRRREVDKTAAVTLDRRYLAALRAGLPEGAGMALGFDRLVMILTDQASIRTVLAFAWDEV